MKLIGYELKSGEFNGTKFEGYKLYYSYKNTKIQGLGIGKEYISSRNLNGIDLDSALGHEVEFAYNRFGKVAEVKVLD